MKLLTKLLSKSNNNLDISLYLAEEIKSHLRKNTRYDTPLANLKLNIRQEFGIELDNQQLVEILKLASETVYNNGIRILCDSNGVVASKPLSLCVVEG